MDRKREPSVAERTIAVVFRLDDYHSQSDTDVELELIDILRRHDMPVTVAVTPCVTAGPGEQLDPQDVIPLTRSKMHVLRELWAAGSVDVALHGHTHQAVRGESEGGLTAYEGLDHEEQLAKIAEAKDFLDRRLGAETTTFVPPWNTYDLNTVDVLERLGFRCLSAGVPGVAPRGSALQYLPQTCDLGQVRDAVIAARALSARADAETPVVVAVFHATDFVEAGDPAGRFTYRFLAELLDWLAAQGDVSVRSIGEMASPQAASGHDLSAERYLAYDAAFRACHSPWAVPSCRDVTNHVYLPTHDARRVRAKVYALSMGVYTTLFLGSFALLFAARGLWGQYLPLGAAAMLTTMLATAAIIVKFGFPLYFRRLSLLSLLVGSSTGIGSAILQIVLQ